MRLSRTWGCYWQADHPLTATHWGDSDTLGVGDQVFVVGSPFGVGMSVSAGIVSALNRDLQDAPYDARPMPT
jgi:serine protease Do